ncbi:hypothetical protein HanIR_Chr03g0144171 [Helianthus annuus]|nr:hypothetical protein HanIR_Chr03g0144171 [Helianthus annuus]
MRVLVRSNDEINTAGKSIFERPSPTPLGAVADASWKVSFCRRLISLPTEVFGYAQFQGPSPTPTRAVADALPMSKKLKFGYLCYLCIIGFGMLSVAYDEPSKHDFGGSLDAYGL